MHYIKDIFEHKLTEYAHNKFIRYSKGQFTGPLIGIKLTKNNIRVNTSFHLANELLILMANILKDKEIQIKGNLSWNSDLSADLEKIGIKYLKVKKSRGIFNYTLQNSVVLKTFLEHLGKYNMLISFSDEDMKLTTKDKFPKPNKEIGKDFVKAIFPITMREEILREFAFDVKPHDKLKSIDIEHDILVNDIKVPDVEDFEEARKLATRSGVITRRVSVNGESPIETKVEFEV